MATSSTQTGKKGEDCCYFFPSGFQRMQQVVSWPHPPPYFSLLLSELWFVSLSRRLRLKSWGRQRFSCFTWVCTLRDIRHLSAKAISSQRPLGCATADHFRASVSAYACSAYKNTPLLLLAHTCVSTVAREIKTSDTLDAYCPILWVRKICCCVGYRTWVSSTEWAVILFLGYIDWNPRPHYILSSWMDCTKMCVVTSNINEVTLFSHRGKNLITDSSLYRRENRVYLLSD